MNLITPEYLELNSELHQRNPNYGISGKRSASMVEKKCREFNCTTILDYGCGKQTLAAALPYYVIRGYDPAIKGLDAPPVPADMVICGDVMEHVEEDCVDAVLDHIQTLTQMLVIFVVSTCKANKTLADGRNAHITIHPNNWWAEKMIKRWNIHSFDELAAKPGVDNVSGFVFMGGPR